MTNKKLSCEVVCHYFYNPRYIHQNCRKLQNKNRRFQYVNCQKSLKSTSTPITTLSKSDKTSTCFLSSSSIYVIDSRATDHMTGNSSLFTTLQPHLSTSTISLVDGSTSCVLGSGTIHLIPLVTLTYVLSLPQFSFNLIFVSKLTRTLNCNISFFLDYCFIRIFR